MNNIQTLKGFRDFLPSQMNIRKRVISTFKEIFEKYGFEEIQTPTLEYADVLLGKYGEEAEKLMYLFDDPGGRKVGLNYDLTVPTARFISQNQDLPKPFKRYQIQPSYRAENTQKGRYRQFTQCDIDTIGTTSPLADAEILAITSEAISKLGLTNFVIRVNSRQILFGLIEKANILSGKSLAVLQSIDKLDKRSRDEVEKELMEKKVTLDQMMDLFTYIDHAQPDDQLQQIISYAQKLGAKNIQFDPRMVRGLDYYTGSIFETVVSEPKIGSIAGGGRYDSLIKTLGGPDLPAVGTTFGLERICDVIEELKLWPDMSATSTQVLITVFSNELKEKSLEVTAKLRENDINAELYLGENAKLEKQLRYADVKQIPYAIVIGDNEVKKNTIVLKNLQTRSQREMSLEEAVREMNK